MGAEPIEAAVFLSSRPSGLHKYVGSQIVQLIQPSLIILPALLFLFKDPSWPVQEIN